jgi:dTDP-glucose pyrophosphorylase
MLSIIIPIAGSSEEFTNAGHLYPKPIIEIKGQPMIQWVTDSLKTILVPFKLLFIIKEEHSSKYHLDNTLKLILPTCEIIQLKEDTKGGLCSVLMTIDSISESDTLLILNGDQILDVNFQEVLDDWSSSMVDAGVITFLSVHPRWSYVLENEGRIIQTAEKNPISKMAIAGCYYFQSAGQFFQSAFKTILKDNQVNGNFYISSVLNEYILNNLQVGNFKIDKSGFTSFYSPKLIAEFENKKL